MKLARVLARKTITSALSPASAARPSGTWLSHCRRASSTLTPSSRASVSNADCSPGLHRRRGHSDHPDAVRRPLRRQSDREVHEAGVGHPGRQRPAARLRAAVTDNVDDGAVTAPGKEEARRMYVP